MISSYKCSILLGLDKAKQRFSRLEIETVSNQSEVLKWVPLLRSRCETYSNQRGSPDQNGVKDFLKLNLNSYFYKKLSPVDLVVECKIWRLKDIN